MKSCFWSGVKHFLHVQTNLDAINMDATKKFRPTEVHKTYRGKLVDDN